MDNSKITYEMIETMKHCIGFDEHSKTYVRKGLRYYDAYRNYFYGNDKVMDELVDLGFANKKGEYYNLTVDAFEFLFRVLSVRIKGVY